MFFVESINYINKGPTDKIKFNGDKYLSQLCSKGPSANDVKSPMATKCHEDVQLLFDSF